MKQLKWPDSHMLIIKMSCSILPNMVDVSHAHFFVFSALGKHCGNPPVYKTNIIIPVAVVMLKRIFEWL